MADNNLERLLIQVDAETEKMRRQMRQGGQAAEQFQKRTDRSLKKIDRRFDALAKSAAKFKSRLAGSLGALAGGAGFAAVVRGAQGAAAEFDALAKAADTRGLNTDFYQTLQLAAEEAGVKQSILNSSLTAFVKRVGEARAGTGALITTIKKVDPALLENIQAARTQEEALRLLADSMAGMESAADRAALASAAFSRAGVDLVRVLGNGSRALDDTAAKARELGIVVDERILRNMEQVNNDFGVATRVIDLQFKQALIAAAPIIKDFAQSLASMAESARIFFENMRPIGERSTFVLQENITETEAGLREVNSALDELRAKRDQLQASEGGLFSFRDTQLRNVNLSIEEMTRRQQELQSSLRENANALTIARRSAEALSMRTRETATNTGQAADQAERFGRGLSTSIVPAKNLQDEVKQMSTLGQSVAGGVDSLLGKAFSDGQIAAKDFQNTLQSILSDITRAIVRTQILQPLLGGGGAGGGLLAGIFHGGGTVGSGGVSRSVSPLAFAKAPRLHNGLGANEFPAILERGERVIPRGQTGGMAAAPVKVEVINNTGGQVRQETARGPNGESVRRIVIEEVNRAITRGDTDQSFRGRFGQAPQKVVR